MSVAQTNTNGDMNHPISVTVYKEIVDTLQWERDVGKTLSPLEIFRGKVTRRRLLIGASPGVLTSSTGNIIGMQSQGHTYLLIICDSFLLPWPGAHYCRNY